MEHGDGSVVVMTIELKKHELALHFQSLSFAAIKATKVMALYFSHSNIKAENFIIIILTKVMGYQLA